jgi:hypothetical protein
MGYALRLPLMSNVRAHLRMFRVLATLVISLPAMAVDQTTAAEAQLGSLSSKTLSKLKRRCVPNAFQP